MADRGVGLGSVLSDRAAAFALHDGAVDVGHHPARSVGVSRGRSARTSPVRKAVPSNTSMMSRTWPSLFGPGSLGSVRQVAAAFRIAAICSKLSAWGVPFFRCSGEVP